VWVVLIACSCAGAVGALMFRRRRQLQVLRPRNSLGAYLDAALVGVGVVMGAALAFLALAVVLARLL